MRYWKRVDTSGNLLTVESYSHDNDIVGAVEISIEEYTAAITQLSAAAIIEKNIAPEILQYGIDVKKAVEDNKSTWALLKADERINTLAKIIGLVQ